MINFLGQLLYINLSTGSIRKEPLNEEYAGQFLGGAGLACRYFYDIFDFKADAFSPDNPLIFMSGALNGTGAPSCGRWEVAGRSPLTGIYGHANCGAYFGSELRLAGYSGIIVTGTSPEPVYIHIIDGTISLNKASHLWNKNSLSTIDAIKQETGDTRTRVVAIGPAGEKRVLISAIITDGGRAAARTGLGAVMGSKNLKAIAVRGKGKISLANPEQFKMAALKNMRELKQSFLGQMMNQFGTSSYVDSGLSFGDMPLKYFTGSEFPGATNLSGITMAETILTNTSACFGCPIGCGRVVHVKNGEYNLPEGQGPEYETVGSFGTSLLISDLKAVNYMNHLCAFYGLDTISAGVSMAFAFHLFDTGVIQTSDTGGMKLEWGDAAAAVNLLNQIGNKEGFGSIVSEGVKRMGKRYNRSDDASEVKGLEVPMHDPRAFLAMGLAYATAPRGACHNKGDAYSVEIGMFNPDLGLQPGDRFGNDKASMVFTTQNWRAFNDCIGLCHFAALPINELSQILETSGDIELDKDDMLTLGERTFQLQRAVSCRLGVSSTDDRLPPLLTRPLSGGGTEGNIPDMKKMLPEYYSLRGWDPKTGKPSKDKLSQLGMDKIGADIWAQEQNESSRY
jgi:aldehyde:ferredoxin oxidoreductase